ncbi:WD40 repeat domain-containing protein, partial [Micromonospora sp. WMMD956]
GKINARDRIILPRSDHVEVKEITAAANVRPVLHPVRTVSGASFLSRLPGWRRVASTLITVALLAAATGGAAAVYQSVARGRTVADLGRSEISNAAKALQDRATQVRAADPVGALRLSTAAVALDDTPAVRANLIDLLTSTRYRGTLLPDENAAYVSGLQLNTDGTVMLASAENGAQIWTSEGARAWTPHTIPSGGVLSPDGTLVAAPEGDGHRLIDVTDPAKPRPAAMVPAASPVTFSPDSRSLIAGTYPPTVWSLTDPEQPERIGPAGNPEDGDRSAGAIAMCGTTTVAVGHLGATRLYRLRDSAAAELLAETDGNPNREIGVLVCTDELLVAADLGQIGVGDLDSSVTVWEIDEPVKPVRYATLGAQQGIATGLALHDRTLAVTGDSGTRIGFLPYSEAGEGRFEDVAMVAGIGSVAFGSGDDMLFTGRLDRGPGISLWDITDVSDADLISNNDAAFAWSTSLAGDLLAASGSAPSRIGEEQGPEVTLLRATADGRLARLSSLKLPPGGTDSYYPEVALSPDRQLLAASLPGGARLWHLDEHGRPTRAGDVANSAPFTALSFTHDPRVLIGIDQRGNASVWDLTDPARPRAAGTLTGPGNGTEAAWSSLSAAVGAPVMATASTDGSRVVLWRTDDPLAPVPASTIVLPPLPTSTALTPREFEPLIELAPNGRRLITTEGTSSRLKLWELHDLTKPAGMSLPEQVAGHDVAFGPTGNLLGTLGGEMATAHLWDLTDARHPVQLRRVISGPQGHSQVSNVQFGEAMFYVGETMRGLPVAEQARMSVNPRAYACGIVGHGPNRSEWAAVLPGREWQEACP